MLGVRIIVAVHHLPAGQLMHAGKQRVRCCPCAFKAKVSVPLELCDTVDMWVPLGADMLEHPVKIIGDESPPVFGLETIREELV